ncbi:hypothetical protein [Zooshikella harenae]|uniref:Uncharacterized protein n=1 Tax=Zooshikella harenae TaxID=2827238 RepID=A0ABS5ZJP5_9GAMM|nr:hypothetical protein [Zooshikella harenae]MBU2714306.1 hypothetical protein [Zooshikella harenae]
MIISDIDILRDGGSIIFQITEGELSGFYYLETPLKGVERNLMRNGSIVEVDSKLYEQIRLELVCWVKKNVNTKEYQKLRLFVKNMILEKIPPEASHLFKYILILTVVNFMENKRKG